MRCRGLGCSELPGPRPPRAFGGASAPAVSPRAAGPAPAAPGHVQPGRARRFPADAGKFKGVQGAWERGWGGGWGCQRTAWGGGHTHGNTPPVRLSRARPGEGAAGRKLGQACHCRRGAYGGVQGAPAPREDVQGAPAPREDVHPGRAAWVRKGTRARPGKSGPRGARAPVSGGRALWSRAFGGAPTPAQGQARVSTAGWPQHPGRPRRRHTLWRGLLGRPQRTWRPGEGVGAMYSQHPVQLSVPSPRLEPRQEAAGGMECGASEEVGGLAEAGARERAHPGLGDGAPRPSAALALPSCARPPPIPAPLGQRASTPVVSLPPSPPQEQPSAMSDEEA